MRFNGVKPRVREEVAQDANAWPMRLCAVGLELGELRLRAAGLVLLGLMFAIVKHAQVPSGDGSSPCASVWRDTPIPSLVSI